MIDVIKRTPEAYSRISRDYQILARLYSALFNISKSYIDSMSVWDRDIDNNLTTLRAKTLNFQPKHSWALDDLEAVTTCFKYLMMNKGTEKAIEYCISILMKIEKVNGPINEDTVIIRDNNLTIRLEEGLLSWGVLEDLVKYLLPAGFTYRVIRYSSLSTDNNISKFNYGDVKLKYRRFGRKSDSEGEWDPMLYIGESSENILSNTYVYDNESNDVSESIGEWVYIDGVLPDQDEV